jgi:hypothetical protein
MTTVLPQHAALLAASGISDAVAEARGYRSVTTKAELMRLGFSAPQRRVPALLIPVFGVSGEIATYQVRPDEPRIRGGKPVKYEIPAGSRMVLDVHPACRLRLADPKTPLFITEGIRKGDAAASKGLCCITFLGVWNWRGTNDQGGKVALSDFESVALNGRAVYIAFDSDAWTKPSVAMALRRLRDFLAGRGADVHVIRLPAGPGGVRTGLDDYLAGGHTVDDLLDLVTDEVPGPGPQEPSEAVYQSRPIGLVHVRVTRDGTVEDQLTNYGARIIADISEDDGAEVRRFFEIEATLGARIRTFRIGAAEFGTMVWATQHLGAGAVTYPGFGIKDHARAAIQLLSGTPLERTVFTHTGWRTVEGTDVYLHAGGAVGPDGPVPGIEVRLESPLDRFCLPAPPIGDALTEAVRASLRLLNVAEDTITFPLVGAIYRAPLGESDLSVHLVGMTQVFKTELAALAQAHWGPALDARHLPASWSSTANANEELAFRAKDAVCVVDDFAPRGTRADVERLHGSADRLMRAQGNRAGRGRMRADGSLWPVRPPRGLIVSTGEDVPRGQSLNARIVVVQVGPGAVSVTALTRCQQDAAAGFYAAAMAGYIQKLAKGGQAARTALRAESIGSEGLEPRSHRRIASNLRSLTAGVLSLLAFATSVDAITTFEDERFRARAVAAFASIGEAQRAEQAASNPAQRFLDLIGSTLASGQAHVAGPNGDAPTRPEAWGWRLQAVGPSQEWRSQGLRIGWVDDADLYLDPMSAVKAAQALGGAIGDGIVVTSRTLHTRLFEAGLLRSAERERGRFTARQVLDGRRRSVLHLAVSSLQELAQVAQPSPASGSDASGAVDSANASATTDANGPQNKSEPALVDRIRVADGPDGPPVRPTEGATGADVVTHRPLSDRWSEEPMKWTG